MTIYPLINIFPKMNFPQKYVNSRALSSIVVSRIYAFHDVKFTSVPKLGCREGGSSQFWQRQDFESAHYANRSLIFPEIALFSGIFVCSSDTYWKSNKQVGAWSVKKLLSSLEFIFHEGISL